MAGELRIWTGYTTLPRPDKHFSAAFMTILRDLKRAQFLANVQQGAMGLGYAIFTLALALAFTDDGRSYVMSLLMVGLVLIVGGLIIGRMAAHVAQFTDTLERLTQLRREMEQRPKPLLNVVIRPVPDADCRYAVTVYNGSPDALVDASLDHSGLLHPGKFGLDDTHMPGDIWCQPPMRFGTLGPGEQITSEVLGYDVVERYDGPKDTVATISAKRISKSGAALGAACLTAKVRMHW